MCHCRKHSIQKYYFCTRRKLPCKTCIIRRAQIICLSIFLFGKAIQYYAIVTIKAKDKQLLQKALEVENIQLLEQHNKHFTALSKYNNLKQIARQLDVKLEFLIIDKNQLTKLS